MSFKIVWEQGDIKEAHVSVKSIRISEDGQLSTRGGSSSMPAGFAMGVQYIVSTDDKGKEIISGGETIMPLELADVESIIGKVESVLSSKKERLELREKK
jgi:hypothetical protein